MWNKFDHATLAKNEHIEFFNLLNFYIKIYSYIRVFPKTILEYFWEFLKQFWNTFVNWPLQSSVKGVYIYFLFIIYKIEILL